MSAKCTSLAQTLTIFKKGDWLKHIKDKHNANDKNANNYNIFSLSVETDTYTYT